MIKKWAWNACDVFSYVITFKYWTNGYGCSIILSCKKYYVPRILSKEYISTI